MLFCVEKYNHRTKEWKPLTDTYRVKKKEAEDAAVYLESLEDKQLLRLTPIKMMHRVVKVKNHDTSHK